MNDFGEIFPRGYVNIGVIAERSARQCIEAMEQFEAMGHDENDADVRDKRDRADLIHEITIHFRTFQTHDTAERRPKRF